ncbi:hypothetical protein [Biformimicrobium ophioploci]|uniref:Uncharacterized protein n=1 Tax=Biformimicrobium ophioploci TaxID=3036711 RepID=A0ABQ6LXZ5_9GAMM|nr:hypothetical protein [Microbulbifer sp. NKW57]GMG86944.1 hypothetical protein MNKW57_12650 [Microbulbifer sp. NKW57]
MKTLLKFAVFLFATLALSSNTLADTRSYSQGTVWEVSYIRTEPGHFDHYMDNLQSKWKKFLEAEIESGTVISYKVIAAQPGNLEDWDLMLLVERPNFATYDKGPEYYDEIAKKVLNQTREQGAEATIERGKIRTILGNRLGQELVLK